MTEQKIGHLFRALLFNDGSLYLSSNLSDMAAYNLYDSLKNLGFTYYIDKYKRALEQENNGSLVPMQELDKLIEKRAMDLISIDNSYVSHEEFYKKLKSFYLSPRSVSVLEQVGHSLSDYDSIVERFEENVSRYNSLVNVESSDELYEVSDVEISTPEDFIKLIDETEVVYDDIINENSDLSDEEKNQILANKEKQISNLKEKLSLFLYERVQIICESSDLDERDIKEFSSEINRIVDIFRNYLHDEEAARYVEKFTENFGIVDIEITSDMNLYNSVIDNLKNSELDESERTEYEAQAEEMIASTIYVYDELVKTAGLSQEEKEEINNKKNFIVSEMRSKLAETKSKSTVSEEEIFFGAPIIEKQADLENIDEVKSSPVDNEYIVDNSSVIEQDVSDTLIKEEQDDLENSSDAVKYENFSNDELYVILSDLIEKIEVAVSENSDNLSELIIQGNVLQEELDRRISGIASEEESIRNSKHFTSEVKEQLIDDLYEDKSRSRQR